MVKIYSLISELWQINKLAVGILKSLYSECINAGKLKVSIKREKLKEREILNDVIRIIHRYRQRNQEMNKYNSFRKISRKQY